MTRSLSPGVQESRQMWWPCGRYSLILSILLTSFALSSKASDVVHSVSARTTNKNGTEPNSPTLSQSEGSFKVPAGNSSRSADFRHRMLDTDSGSVQSIDATTPSRPFSGDADWTPIFPGGRSVTPNDRVVTERVIPAPVQGRVSRSVPSAVTSASSQPIQPPPRRSPPRLRRPSGQGLRLSDRLASSVTPTPANHLENSATPPIRPQHGSISEVPPATSSEIPPDPNPVEKCDVTRQGPGGYCRNGSVLTVLTPDAAGDWREFSIITLPSSLMSKLATRSRVVPSTVVASAGPRVTSTAVSPAPDSVGGGPDDQLESRDGIVFPDDSDETTETNVNGVLESTFSTELSDSRRPTESTNTSAINRDAIIFVDTKPNMNETSSTDEVSSNTGGGRVVPLTDNTTSATSTTPRAHDDQGSSSLPVNESIPTNTTELTPTTEQTSTPTHFTTHPLPDDARISGGDANDKDSNENNTVSGDVNTINTPHSNSTEVTSTSTAGPASLDTSFERNTTASRTDASTVPLTTTTDGLDNSTASTHTTSIFTDPTTPTDTELTTPTDTALTPPTDSELTTPTQNESTTSNASNPTTPTVENSTTPAIIDSTTPTITNSTTFNPSDSTTTPPIELTTPTHVESTTLKYETLTTPTAASPTTPINTTSTAPSSDRTENTVPYTTDSVSPTAAPVPVYVRVVLLSTVTQFCKLELQFRGYLAVLVNIKTRRRLTAANVVMFNAPMCSLHYAGAVMRRKRSATNRTRPTVREAPSLDRIIFSLYVTDNSGEFNENLTRAVKVSWSERNSSDYLMIPDAPIAIHSLTIVEQDPGGAGVGAGAWSGRPGMVVATVLATLAVVAATGLLVVLLLMRRRRQYQQESRGRCNPVSLEQLGNESVFGSLRRHGKIRRSLRSYMNQAFDQRTPPSHLPSNRVNFAGLANMSSDLAALKDEFDSVPSGHMPSSEEMPPGTEACNRYANVLPIAETRVVLHSKGSSTCTDYINANYIRGPNQEPQYYIATQAPLESTTSDFWRMVWQSQCRTVVCLTDVVERGVRRCAEYLPPSDAVDRHRLYGEFQVTLTSKQKHQHYVISRLQLKSMDGDVYRELRHLWFSSWPDRGVPTDVDVLMKFMLEIRRAADNHVGPLLVHCSPGTGRTGVVLASDSCMRQFDASRSADVLRTVSLLRQDRAGAVQTRDQYALIYKVLNHYATAVTSGNLPALT